MCNALIRDAILQGHSYLPSVTAPSRRPRTPSNPPGALEADSLAMSSSQNKEIDAFIVLLATFDLEHAVLALSDLSDGAALFDVLKMM